MASEEEKKRNINLPIGESELNCQEHKKKSKMASFLSSSSTFLAHIGD